MMRHIGKSLRDGLALIGMVVVCFVIWHVIKIATFLNIWYGQ